MKWKNVQMNHNHMQIIMKKISQNENSTYVSIPFFSGAQHENEFMMKWNARLWKKEKNQNIESEEKNTNRNSWDVPSIEV